MTREEILREIEALTAVVNANKGFWGNDVLVRKANARIAALMMKLKSL